MMKHHLRTGSLLMLLSLVHTGFSQQKPAKLPSNFIMRGAYTMFRQTFSGASGDSLLSVHQLKLFNDKYVMYARRRPQDSLANFGIGTYRVENGSVVENIFYTDGGPQRLTQTLMISPEPGGYTQVVNFPGADENAGYRLTENYKKFGKKVRSPLDGAWQMVRTISTSADGQETTNEKAVQFKMFEAGNFIWANSTLDSVSGQYISRYGFGTFEMKTSTQAAELNLSTTYSAALEGKPVTLNLRFPSNDQYEQTITYADGSRYTEIYKRLN